MVEGLTVTEFVEDPDPNPNPASAAAATTGNPASSFPTQEADSYKKHKSNMEQRKKQRSWSSHRNRTEESLLGDWSKAILQGGSIFEESKKHASQADVSPRTKVRKAVHDATKPRSPNMSPARQREAIAKVIGGQQAAAAAAGAQEEQSAA